MICFALDLLADFIGDFIGDFLVDLFEDLHLKSNAAPADLSDFDINIRSVVDLSDCEEYEESAVSQDS